MRVYVAAEVRCPKATYLLNSFLNISLFVPHLREVSIGALILQESSKSKKGVRISCVVTRFREVEREPTESGG